MNSTLRVFAAVGAFFALASQRALAQSISVSDKIRYPTSYREQSVESMIDSRYRAPIPENFETRTVGVSQKLQSVGVVAAKAAAPAPSQTFYVVFPDGTEAEFRDGATTVIKGVPYRGVGFRYGMYRAQNMITGDIVFFKAPRPNR